jgi:alpha-mannosidase
VLSTATGRIDDAKAGQFGWNAAVSFETIFTRGGLAPPLPPVGRLLEKTNDKIVLLAGKRGVDGSLILRFWSLSDRREQTTVTFPLMDILSVELTSIVEEPTGSLETVERKSLVLVLEKRTIATVAVRLQNAAP